MSLRNTDPAEDRPIWMVNLMKYRERAEYADGREISISGREADELYAPRDVLAELGAEIAFVGDVEAQLLGAEPRWDRIAVVKYASRRSFIAMQSREDFQKKHVHKVAGMRETIVMGCEPLDVPETVDGSSADSATAPNPPTAEDGSVVVMHVIRFEGSVGADAIPDGMAAYQQAARGVATEQGARMSGMFGVQGTIIGDGRSWDQVRFNAFPSMRAFRAVIADPTRLAAQPGRQEAIADTYTMIIRPDINRLRELM